MRRFILCLLVLCFMPLRLEGKTVPSRAVYYVSMTGDDNSPGTQKAPWRTLQHAADCLSAGETVRVLPGKYAGFVLGWDDPVIASAEYPIVFRADPGATIVQPNRKTPDGIDIENARHVVIEGFRIVGIKRAGIRVCKTSHITLRNNVCDGNGNWGIFTSHSSDTLIENNLACRSVHEHGIYVSNSARSPIVRGNTLIGNARAGIHMNGDVSQGGEGVITNALVENNFICDNGANGASAINCDGVVHSRIQNNLLYDNHASGISLYCTDGAAGSRDNKITGNVILMSADARWALNIKDVSTGNAVFNNVLLNANPARGAITIAADCLRGFSSDCNLVEDRFSTDGGDTRLTLAQWQKATGQDGHSRSTAWKPMLRKKDPGAALAQ